MVGHLVEFWNVSQAEDISVSYITDTIVMLFPRYENCNTEKITSQQQTKLFPSYLELIQMRLKKKKKKKDQSNFPPNKEVQSVKFSVVDNGNLTSLWKVNIKEKGHIAVIFHGTRAN